MNIFLQGTDESRLPPEEVRLQELQIIPHPQGNKLNVSLELTPFKQRPNIDVTIFDASGKQVAHTSILEAVLNKIELVMHLRTPVPGSHYRVEACVYYQELPEMAETQVEVPLPEPLVVDRREIAFDLPLRDS